MPGTQRLRVMESLDCWLEGDSSGICLQTEVLALDLEKDKNTTTLIFIEGFLVLFFSSLGLCLLQELFIFACEWGGICKRLESDTYWDLLRLFEAETLFKFVQFISG